MATKCCLKLLISLFNWAIFIKSLEYLTLSRFLIAFKTVGKAGGVSEHKYLENS